ncbi:hypothetical protein J3F83DRAFT_741022 [Trichoderma novae-zelandiae]
MIELRDFLSSEARHGIAKRQACGATPLLTRYTTPKENEITITHEVRDEEKKRRKTNEQRMAGASSTDWVPGGWVAGAQLKPSFLASFTIADYIVPFPIQAASALSPILLRHNLLDTITTTYRGLQ